MTGPSLFQSFSVPLVSRDVSDEEVVRDITRQLQALDRTVDVIFNNITARVAAEKRRMECVRERTATVQRLFASLQGRSSRGTTVSSSSSRNSSRSMMFVGAGHRTTLMSRRLWRLVHLVSWPWVCVPGVLDVQVPRTRQAVLPACPAAHGTASHARSRRREYCRHATFTVFVGRISTLPPPDQRATGDCCLLAARINFMVVVAATSVDDELHLERYWDCGLVQCHGEPAPEVVCGPGRGEASVLLDDGLLDEALQLFARVNICNTDHVRPEVQPARHGPRTCRCALPVRTVSSADACMGVCVDGVWLALAGDDGGRGAGRAAGLRVVRVEPAAVQLRHQPVQEVLDARQPARRPRQEVGGEGQAGRRGRQAIGKAGRQAAEQVWASWVCVAACLCVRARKESREEDGKKGLASAPVTMVDGTTPPPSLPGPWGSARPVAPADTVVAAAAVWCVV